MIDPQQFTQPGITAAVVGRKPTLNPLAVQPPNTSPQFSLNAIDWAKIFRFMLVQAVGLFVTLGVPNLLNFRYVYHGVDYTVYVVATVNGVAEAGRRFLSSQPK